VNKQEIAEILAKPYSQDLLSGKIPARFAYIGLDGDPRVVPIGFHWDGETLQIFTVPKSAKVKALERNPRVSITIDTESFPPKVLLLRGSAKLTRICRPSLPAAPLIGFRPRSKVRLMRPILAWGASGRDL